VTFAKPFAIGKYEVTFAEYDRFAEATGVNKPNDEGWGRGSRPVINVSWEDARKYASWLSGETGKSYRLPTEAEWEYATRAGTETPWSFGDKASDLGKYAWYTDNSNRQTQPVGQKLSNPYGLHDLHGNASEWTGDC
jgi:formylglycine-generating enzyme required for sulfatase activity